MSSRRSFGVLLLLLVASAPLYSQSLGELARREEARRGSAQKSKRSFSDADLGPRAVATPSQPPPSCYVSVREGGCLTADEIIANSQSNIAGAEAKKQEPMVRQEAAAIRAEFARVQSELDELSSTVADGSLPQARRSAAADTLAKRQAILEHMKQRWSKLEKYVAQHRVPREWIEPVPDLVSRNPQ